MNDDLLGLIMDQDTPILPPSNRNQTTNKFIYILTFFSAIGGFLFGYDTGVISGAMIILKDEFKLNNLWQELIVAITVGFAAVFALFGGVLNSFLGRRIVILLASIVFLAGSILLATAYNKEMLLIGRAIVGAGIGLTSMTVPMYIAEVAPPHLRGRLVTVNNLFITGGQFIASCIDGFFSSDKVNGWRYMLGLASVPAFIQFVGFLFLPESPRWLMQKDRYDKASDSLVKVLGNEHEAQEQYHVLKRFVENEKNSENEGGFFRVLTTRSVRRALIIGCGLQMFQQLSGINTVMYYSATIVQMSGVRDDSLAIWLAAATAFVNFLFTFVGVWLVERMGRRLLSLLSIAGVTFALLFLSTGFFLSSEFSPQVLYNATTEPADSMCNNFRWCSGCIQSISCGYCYTPGESSYVSNATCLLKNSTYPQVSKYGPCTVSKPNGPYFASDYCPTQFSWMAMLGMILYLAFFAPGMGPMPWTINSEIYPQWARNTGIAASTTTNWIFNVIVSLTFLDVTQALTTQGAFLLYAIFSFAGFIFMFLFLPETKGKRLEEVERLFDNNCIVCCVDGTKALDYHVILSNDDNKHDDEDTDEDTLFVK